MDPQATHDELIERLTLLAKSPELDEGQRALACAWRDRLDEVRRRASAPLSVAFLAQVGRGKSTLIAAATGLRLPVDGTPKKWSVLPVGDGRTTLGETRIEFEDRDDILLQVEPVAEGELRMELRLFARDLWKANASKGAPPSAGGAGEEFYGLLRVWLVPGQSKPRAVLDELARAAADAEGLEQALLSRVDLEQRSSAFEQTFTSDPDGLRALRDSLKKLMRGELANAPAPQVVRICVPRGELGDSIDSIIDTRGVDATVPDAFIRARPDLHELLSDPDTLLVICSEFGSAPDMVAIELLRAHVELMGERAVSLRSWRFVIVDNRGLDDGPDDSERQEREREERIEQCQDRLRREGLPAAEGSVVTIDARRQTEALRGLLAQMADEQRRHRIEAWSDTLEHTIDASASLQRLDFAARARELTQRLWWALDAVQAHAPAAPTDGLATLARLIADRSEIQHWSHLNAAIRRRGRYRNLRLDLLGARTIAALLTKPYREAILKNRASISDIGGFGLDLYVMQLDSIGSAVTTYENALVQSWQEAFARYFDSTQSDELWGWCERRWGQGSGYVRDVADRFSEESERTPIRIEVGPRPSELFPPRPALFSLHKIDLLNFRGIKHRSITIADTTTVLVGDNGLGKTCWLEAIAASVGVLLPGMGAGPAPELFPHDVRQVVRQEVGGAAHSQPQFPVVLDVEATVEGRALTWRRSMDALDEDEKATTEADAVHVMTRKIGEELRAHSDRQLPVLAYYGTQRLWPTDLEPDDSRREVGSRLDGYRNCLEAASTHRNMLDWVRRYTMVEIQRGKPVVQLRAIERAVVCCVGEAERFHYDLAFEDFVLTMNDGSIYPFRMLSDGYRNIVAMVADIAWRASMLNLQLGDRAPALAEGVVLIDEIDLHLHPRWQRRVLADLRRAFPRLQFITTTHSPFIIQSLEPGQLVNLAQGPEDPPPPYSNESPEDITERIMGVDVPQRSERRQREYEVAKRYYDLLDGVSEADEAELARLKDELDEILAPYSDNQAFVAFLELKRAAAETSRR